VGSPQYISDQLARQDALKNDPRTSGLRDGETTTMKFVNGQRVYDSSGLGAQFTDPNYLPPEYRATPQQLGVAPVIDLTGGSATGGEGLPLGSGVLGGPEGGVTGGQTSLTPVDPNNDLRGQQIAPSNGVDRFSIAKSRMSDWLANELPQFQHELRNHIQGGAALGRLGSGMLRTDVGNLDLAEQQKANAMQRSFLQDALEGTIGDARSNRDELRRERDYQTGQQQTAFQQEVIRQQLQEALKSGDFSRAIQLLSAGSSGNPGDMAMMLAQLYGNQAGAAGQGAGTLLSGANQSQSGGGLADLLKVLYGNKNPNGTPDSNPFVLPSTSASSTESQPWWEL
jgi:hypothetical protein